jgi:hypothetical protein
VNEKGGNEIIFGSSLLWCNMLEQKLDFAISDYN